MRLQDGQVVDFTKDSTPYVDPRFNAAAVTSDPLVQAMLQTSFPTAPVEPVALDLTEEVVEEPEIKFVLQQPYPATLPKEYNVASAQWNPPKEFVRQWDLPSTQQVIVDKVMPSNLTVKIQSRIDALSSLEDTTMEIVATIRTLKWVLSEINK